jgi:cytoskeletal protein CcmA (bactofilin family)
MKQCVSLVIIILAIASQLRGETITWNNNYGGDWLDARNWSPMRVPNENDDVIILGSPLGACYINRIIEEVKVKSIVMKDGPDGIINNMILWLTHYTITADTINIESKHATLRVDSYAYLYASTLNVTGTLSMGFDTKLTSDIINVSGLLTFKRESRVYSKQIIITGRCEIDGDISAQDTIMTIKQGAVFVMHHGSISVDRMISYGEIQTMNDDRVSIKGEGGEISGLININQHLYLYGNYNFTSTAKIIGNRLHTTGDIDFKGSLENRALEVTDLFQMYDQVVNLEDLTIITGSTLVLNASSVHTDTLDCNGTMIGGTVLVNNLSMHNANIKMRNLRNYYHTRVSTGSVLHVEEYFESRGKLVLEPNSHTSVGNFISNNGIEIGTRIVNNSFVPGTIFARNGITLLKCSISLVFDPVPQSWDYFEHVTNRTVIPFKGATKIISPLHISDNTGGIAETTSLFVDQILIFSINRPTSTIAPSTVTPTPTPTSTSTPTPTPTRSPTRSPTPLPTPTTSTVQPTPTQSPVPIPTQTSTVQPTTFTTVAPKPTTAPAPTPIPKPTTSAAPTTSIPVPTSTPTATEAPAPNNRAGIIVAVSVIIPLL